MEHRWSVRKPVKGNVVVECPRHGLIHAAMRDVSLGGMLLETDVVNNLPVHAPVAVVFDLPSAERSDAYCLQAMVVRRTSRGAGLMFLEPDPQVVRAMRNTLYDENTSTWRGAGTSTLGRLPNVLQAGSSRDK